VEKRILIRSRYVVLICLLSGGMLFGAADDRSAAVPKISGKIQVDGILDDPAWAGAPAIDNFTQVDPRSGEPPTEATRVWLAYLKDALYIAVRCEDRKARQIVATEMSRDAEIEENDNIEIILDTYHDHRNAYYFATNPVGALVDGRVTENKEPAFEWDGIWNVRVRTDDKGWTAEFEIPFKTIGFSPGSTEWGFNIARYLARGREKSRWASPSLDAKVSQTAKAGHISGLEGLSQGVGLDVKPYGLAGFTRDINKEDVVQGTAKAGMDIFYRITSNLVSSTTINTDFAETEVDARQINLTRFPTFFPEKRSFFLEDAGIFEFAPSGDGGNNDNGGDLLLFFSRRIGLVQGNEVPLRVGEKLTGTIERFDIGVLDVQTAGLKENGKVLVPNKNLAVGRVKANFLNQSYIGALFTNGDPTGKTSNQAMGLDLNLATSNFLKTEKNLSLMLFGSKTNTSGLDRRDTAVGGVLAFPNDLVEAQYQWTKIGENYHPALGFVKRQGVRVSSVSAQLGPRPKFWGIRRMQFEFKYADYYNLREGSSETQELEAIPFSWRFNSGDRVEYQYSRNTERLYKPWEIEDGVMLPTGAYTFSKHAFELRTAENRSFFTTVLFGTGSFFGGTRREFQAEATWKKNRHLTTSFTLEQNWLRLQQGSFNTALVMYRLDYSFTPLITLANFVQYDTESRNIGLQSRLRWILTPGNELFIVFNHAWQEDQFDRFESAQTRFRVKFNYTFRF
jgi:hypothetical protein